MYLTGSSFLGLTPSEDSNGDDQNRLGINKAGNHHLRPLLIDDAHRVIVEVQLAAS